MVHDCPSLVGKTNFPPPRLLTLTAAPLHRAAGDATFIPAAAGTPAVATPPVVSVSATLLTAVVVVCQGERKVKFPPTSAVSWIVPTVPCALIEAVTTNAPDARSPTKEAASPTGL